MDERRPIQYPEAADPGETLAGSGWVEFVGGPRGGERERLPEAPAELISEQGTYRRSVRCADDGALRHVFEDDAAEIAQSGGSGPADA